MASRNPNTMHLIKLLIQAGLGEVGACRNHKAGVGPAMDLRTVGDGAAGFPHEIAH